MTNTTELATDQPKTVKDIILAKRPQFKTLLPKHIPEERFTRTIMTQMHKNRDLARCTHESIGMAALMAAELGIMPDGRNGALVPFNNKGKKEAVFIPMYQGLIELARQSGQVADIFPATVCENDEFNYELGFNRRLDHKPTLNNRGKPIAFYAVVVFKDGTQTFGTGPMTVEEIEQVKRRAPASNNGPWVTDFQAMAWKTVIRRVLKFCPQSPELLRALEADDRNSTDSGSIFDIEIDAEEKEIKNVNAEIDRQAKQHKSGVIEGATA